MTEGDPTGALGASLAVWLQLGAAAIIGFSGVPGLFMGRRSVIGERIAVAMHLLGAGGAMTGVVMALVGTVAPSLRCAWALPVGTFNVAVDGLTAAFLIPMLIVPAVGAVYGLRYWSQRDHPASGRRVRAFYGLLAASLVMLVIARDGILFLVAWEVMALATFFLITGEDEDEEIRSAAWVNFVATHVGVLALFGMFALLHRMTGSFAMEALPPGTGSLGAVMGVFSLAVLGFGIKAGLMPLHVWLPGAHASAPSHVSAVLSGVLIKTGIYGLARVTGMFPDPPTVWGVTILTLGVTSGILGVVFAIAQHDLKRLLAYHSIENIGIIAIGLGLAVLGRSLGRPEWVVLGLGGAILHVWNHAFFKSLLFLSAGSVVHATHTREIDRLGGLARSMPGTAIFFLIGAVAICGLPPLNGFVSEFLVYLGLLHTLREGPAAAAGLAFAAVAMAIIGALACACFVKVFGAVFLGVGRSEEAAHAREAPRAMLGSMVVLAGLCVVVGVLPILAAPVLDRAMEAWAVVPRGQSPTLAGLAPLWWIGGLAAALWIVLALAYLWLRGRAKAAERVLTWDCGYVAPTARMQYTASSLGEMLVRMFAWVLRPRVRARRLRRLFPARSRFESHTDDLVLEGWIMPALRWISRATVRVRGLQTGRIQVYILYVLAALVVLVLTIIPIVEFLRSIITR